MKEPTPWNISSIPKELDNFSTPNMSTITTDFCEIYVPERTPYRHDNTINCEKVVMAGNDRETAPVKNTTIL